MVKFGKYLKKNKLSDFTYINYKMLKQTLNEIYVKLKIAHNKQDNLSFTPLEKEVSLSIQSIEFDKRDSEGMKSEIQNQSKLFPEFFKNLKRNLLETFTKKLDKEIKNFYCSFLIEEKKMYTIMNKHLHFKLHYADYSIVDLVREIEEVYRLGILADSMNKYVTVNLMCIKRILKKFDKKMKEFFMNTSISVQYIRSKLKIESEDSDINYIITFKQIDEIATLIEYLGNELNHKLSALRPENMYQDKDMKVIDPSDSNQLRADLLNDATNNCYTFEYKRKFNVFYKGIENTVTSLNNNCLFRVNPLELNEELSKDDFLKMSSSVFITSKTENTCKNIVHIKDNDYYHIIELFAPSEAYKSLIQDHIKIISEKNNSNKNILLFHSLIYSLVYAMVISGLPIFLQMNNQSDQLKSINPLLAAFAFITIHLGIEANKIILNLFLVDKQHYFPFMSLNIISTIIATVLFFYLEDSFKENIYLIYPILFFFGYGISDELNLRYLKDYMPRLCLNNILLYEKGMKIIGFVVGIVSSFVFHYAIVILLILLIFSSFCFSNTKSSSFSQINTELALQSKNNSENFFMNRSKYKEQEKNLSIKGRNNDNSISKSESKNSQIESNKFNKGQSEDSIKNVQENENLGQLKKDQVNENLGQLNKDNKYNDANEILQNMKEIITAIKVVHLKLFVYICLHVVVLNFINYSSLFLLVYYFIDHNFEENKMWLPFLFLMPFFSNYFADLSLFPMIQNLKRSRQRSVLITLQIILILWCVFLALSIYEPDLVPKKELYDNSLWKVLFFIFMTIINSLFEYVEKEYFLKECTIKTTKFRINEEKVFKVLGELGRLIGVIVPGLVKLYIEAPQKDNVKDQSNQLQSFICIHLVIDLILLLIFLAVLFMKMTFTHKLVHRLMKEEKFYN